MFRTVGKFLCFLLLALLDGYVPLALAQSVAVSALPLAQANSIIWNATLARCFVSSGTNVLIINPETAEIEDKIPVGSPVSQIAVSDDGQYLYAVLDGLGTINQYRVQDHSLNVQIALGMYTGGNIQRSVTAMVVLPGQPSSLLVATNDRRVAVYDGTVQRSGIATLAVSSLYPRASDGAIFGIADDAQYPDVHLQMYWFTVSSGGVAIAKAVPVDYSWSYANNVTWNGSLVASRNTFSSYVFDLGAGTTMGSLPVSLATGTSGACFLATDSSGTSVIAYTYQFQPSIAKLVQYSLPNFRPVASADATGIPPDALGSLCGPAATWGTDGIVISGYGNLFFLHASGFAALPPPANPAPTTDSNGSIHLALSANGLVFDSGRNLLWASIPGSSAIGNSVVSIDPTNGSVIDRIDAGSEPGALALSSDGSHLFAASGGSPTIESIDLTAKQGSPFSVLDVPNSPYWSARGLAAIGGQGNSVVAVRSAPGVPPHSSVVAYDAGIPRKNTFNNGTGTDEYTQYVQTIFPADNANTFYAADTYSHYGDGTHDVYRLILDSAGVELDIKLNNLLLGSGAGAEDVTAVGQPVNMVVDAGKLFTSAGQILTPDTTRILGSVALAPPYGLPVPFSDQKGVVYVQSYSPQISANFYDLGTLRPLLSIPLLTGPPCGCTSSSPSAVNVTAAVRAGNNAIAIAANGEIIIAPLTGFQAWPSASGAVQNVSPGVQQINIPANAISAFPGTSKLLLATPSAAGSMGNSIVTFNPDKNQLESPAYIGSEPSLLAAAPDGSAVYAWLSGEYNLARLNGAAGSRDLVFAADPTGGSNQQYGVFNMTVGPDGGLAVSSQNAFLGILGGFDQTRPGQFIGIFDNGFPRAQIFANASEPATFELAFNDSGSRLYAYNSFLSSFELVREAVSAQGVQFLSSTQGLIFGYGTQIRFAQGLLYSSNGYAIDPERLVGVGQFQDSWFSGTGSVVAPDLASGRVYFATSSGILVFDSNTYALLGRLPINLGSVLNYPNYPQSLVRFGADRLAFLTNTSQLYIVSISSIPLLGVPVPSPQPPFIAANGIVPLYSSLTNVQPGSWISIFGSNLASQAATWDGTFPTSLGATTVNIDGQLAYLWYVSPNQINAQVPDDSLVGLSVPVQVTTPNGKASSFVTLAQFAPSLSLFDSRYVAAEIPTPDGSGAWGGGTYDLAGPTGHFAFQSRPVKPGETLVLFGVGFGPTNPHVPAGKSFSGSAPTTSPVTVTIGSQAAGVAFSGIVAAGLYQINVVVPNVPSGDQPIQVAVGGTNASLAYVAVQ
jgi:uncharacterized protein (TIGR03437 family)